MQGRDAHILNETSSLLKGLLTAKGTTVKLDPQVDCKAGLRNRD